MWDSSADHKHNTVLLFFSRTLLTCWVGTSTYIFFVDPQKPLMKKEESKAGLDVVALRELDRYQAMTDREKLEFNLAESKYLPYLPTYLPGTYYAIN